jgi:hypothetical protein
MLDMWSAWYTSSSQLQRDALKQVPTSAKQHGKSNQPQHRFGRNTSCQNSGEALRIENETSNAFSINIIGGV